MYDLVAASVIRVGKLYSGRSTGLPINHQPSLRLDSLVTSKNESADGEQGPLMPPQSVALAEQNGGVLERTKSGFAFDSSTPA